MEELILDKKDAADWTYRGEGAVNLVLSYPGSYPPFIGKVLRILKVPRNGKRGAVGCRVLTAHERLLWGEIQELASSTNKDIVEQLFVKHGMRPLLGAKFVDPGIRVLVNREFLQSVEQNVIWQRPAWRVNAAQVDVHRDSVLLLSDHSVFPTEGACISVEIKPKCGFLPVSRLIAKENSFKKCTSRFRMHQALKLYKQEISEFSKCDPLDLFSGSRDRISKAVKALYATPQNNFRVFLNGSLVFGGLGGGVDSTDSRVGEAFEDALKSIIQADFGSRTKSLLQLIADTLHSSRVLDRLLELQKLDSYDIEGAIHAYSNITSQPCMVCKKLDEDKVSQCYTSLHSIPLAESLNIVKDFLIAATAKDCSLMICFRPQEDEHSGSSYSTAKLECTNQVFCYKGVMKKTFMLEKANLEDNSCPVCFIDLDLKPLRKMEYYYELDKKIVSCYTQMTKSEPRADEAAKLDAS